MFAGFLVFDAWIANTDRHAENWAVLTCKRNGRRTLAASFDHGSALASGSQDEQLETADVEQFARRGFAGRFEDGKHVPLVDLALAAVARTGGRAQEWLRKLHDLEPSEIERVISRIPEMSDVRRRFVVDLLLINQRRLTS